MNDSQDPASSDGKTADEAPTGFASIERAFLRLTFWQTLLSLAGVFTGAVALYATLSESQAVRQQTAATVWPYVQVTIKDHVRDDQAEFTLELNNVGVGPARMHEMQLLIAGETQSDWGAVLTSLMGPTAASELRYGRSDVSRRVLAPGESLMFFQTMDRVAVEALQSAIYTENISLSYCYCSIFDECWLAEIKTVGGPEPAAVEQCPSYGDARFGN